MVAERVAVHKAGQGMVPTLLMVAGQVFETQRDRRMERTRVTPRGTPNTLETAAHAIALGSTIIPPSISCG